MLTSSSNTGGEGFNWSDNFRSRAERTSSIAGGGLYGYNGSPPGSLKHDRSKSVAVMEPPMRDIPKPKEQVRPDHFQERILKGDFYMDWATRAQTHVETGANTFRNWRPDTSM